MNKEKAIVLLKKGIIFLLFMIFYLLPNNCKAATIKDTYINLNDYDEEDFYDEDNYDTYYYEKRNHAIIFNINKPQIVVSHVENEKVNVNVKFYKIIQSSSEDEEDDYNNLDFIDWVVCEKEYESWDVWFEANTAGKYILEYSTDDKLYDKEEYEYFKPTIEVKVETYDSYSTSVSLPKTINLKTEEIKNVKYTNISPSKSWVCANDVVSSNSSVCQVEQITGGISIEALKPGKSTVTVTLKNGKRISTNVVVTNPSARLLYKSYTCCKTDTIKNVLKFSTHKVKWKSSNTRIATVDGKGKIKAKNVGNCTITAIDGKKKYTCKIKVVWQNPNFHASLDAYNTRNNYFTVSIKNDSNKPVTIISAGSRAEEHHYKSFDRKLKLSKNKNVTIKPHKSAKLKFYVQGRTTWYKYSDFDLYFNFAFDGKTYKGRSDSAFKKGNTWYNTYWTYADDE